MEGWTAGPQLDTGYKWTPQRPAMEEGPPQDSNPPHWLVPWGWHKKFPKLGRIKQDIYSLLVLEAGSSRSRRRQN